MKERYEKPELGVIELKAEEVLGVGCKSPASPAVNSLQVACGLGVPCVSSGS